MRKVSQANLKTKEAVHIDNQSLSHVRWKCQYHIVFIPKYRKKILYGKLRNDVREIISRSNQKSQEKKKTEVPLYRGPVTTLAIPAFQTRTQTALFRANNKPPLEVVVANFYRAIPGKRK